MSSAAGITDSSVLCMMNAGTLTVFLIEPVNFCTFLIAITLKAIVYCIIFETSVIINTSAFSEFSS